MLVAPAASAALCCNKAVCFAHIRHNGTAVYFLNNRSSRHTNFKTFAVFPMPSAALSGQTVFSSIFTLISEIGKRCQIIVHNKNNIAAFSAVSSVRTACGNIFFTVKRNSACAAVPGFYFNFSYIYKHNFISKSCYFSSGRIAHAIFSNARAFV